MCIYTLPCTKQIEGVCSNIVTTSRWTVNNVALKMEWRRLCRNINTTYIVTARLLPWTWLFHKKFAKYRRSFESITTLQCINCWKKFRKRNLVSLFTLSCVKRNIHVLQIDGWMETRKAAETLQHGNPTRGLWAAYDPTGLIVPQGDKFVICEVIKLYKYTSG
jgi:hypothetical protein